MRIAIVTNVFPAVSETFIANKVKALAARGHAVVVFCSQKNKLLYRQHFSATQNIKVVQFSSGAAARFVMLRPALLFKTVPNGTKKNYLWGAYRTHVINSNNPDVVHFQFSGIGIDYLDFLPIMKGKKIVSCRGSAEKVKLLIDRERKQQFVSLIDAAHAVHCVSDDMRQTIQDYGASSKIFINYPSINAQFFKRKSTDPPGDITMILSVGRFTFQKNYLTALLTLRVLANTGVSFKWVVVGVGPQYEEVCFHIHQLQLQDYVDMVGSKPGEAIKALLDKAHIFLLTSVYEGIANAALEAMSMEVPVVSTACGGMPEVITSGENGLLAGIYDHGQLAQHLLYLIQHPAEAKTMGEAGRRRVLEQFTLEQQTNIFENVYQQLLTG